MKDELTEKMHAEFYITPETERKHKAWAVFDLLSRGVSQSVAMNGMGFTVDELRPYLDDWRSLSTKRVTLD